MINQVHDLAKKIDSTIMVLHDKANTTNDKLEHQNTTLKIMCGILIVIAGLIALIAWG